MTNTLKNMGWNIMNIDNKSIMEKLKLRNKQYEDFILSHIVRPYQEGDIRIESITFSKNSKKKASYYYFNLLDAIYNDTEWFGKVVSRLVGIYDEIDFSFFPEYDAIAQELKEHLIENGIKPSRRYE